MIKIKEKPIYTIDVYEGSAIIDDKEFVFTIDSSDSYAEIKWDNARYKLDYSMLLDMEDEILEKFSKII